MDAMQALEAVVDRTLEQRARLTAPARDDLVEWSVDWLMDTGTDELDPFAKPLPTGGEDIDALVSLCREVCGRRVDGVLARLAALPRPTDVDKLEQAYAALEAGGILCRHTFGATGRDAIGRLLHEEVPAARAAGLAVHGVAWCNRQTVEHALEDGQLALSFGALSGDAAKGEAVGAVVLTALQDAGLTATWSGRRQDPIVLKGVDWLANPGRRWSQADLD